MSTEKVNLKETLNLPKTSFPMKANLTQREPEIQKVWEKINLFEKIRKKSRGKEKFILHDGPPYANGPIHIGHLFNKVLKDLVVRTKTMSGHDANFIPGWDCHGLPIEHKVLSEIGKEASNYSKIKIRRKCKSYAEKFVKLQSSQMQRLGTLGDYKHPYLTMSADYEEGVLEIFSALVKNGLVYRALKPVHWSIENKTALAEAELEYYERKDPSIYVLFEIKNPLYTLPKSLSVPSNHKIYLMIWTTTPWTLPANLAVAVSPQAEYGLYSYSEKEEKTRFVIVAKALAEKVFEAAGIKTFKLIGTCKGTDLSENKVTYLHPFIERQGRVVAADYVSLDEGTGLVHTAPGHGMEDYQTGLKEGLEIYCPVREDGTFDDTVPSWLRGVDVWSANKIIIDKLREKDLLYLSTEVVHSYPHDWRSKTPIIFRATEQWFIAIDKKFGEKNQTLRELALNSIEKDVTFYPQWGKNRLKGMLEHRPDWCISRQRAWGLPIPAFVNRTDKSILLTPASVRAVAKKVREHGSDIWFLADPKTLLEEYDPTQDKDAPEWIKSNYPSVINDLKKIEDIFDVWFESGSSWHCVLIKRNIGFPADLYLEGSDQHRGWFQLSLLPSLGVKGVAPFKSLLTHGFMVDARGRKMSKSGGNAIEVDSILKRYGADVCRWWVSTLKYSNDIKVDWEFFEVAAEEYRKIRNTIRFLLANLYDFDLSKDAINFEEEDFFSIDYWALCKLGDMVEEVKESYSRFDFKRASELLFEFCHDTMSAIYLAAVKDRLYCDHPSSRRRRRTQTAILKIVDSLIKLVAPILVHTSEEAYKALPGNQKEDSVHLCDFPKTQKYKLSPIWEYIMEIRHKCLKELEIAKKEKGLTNPLDAGIELLVEKEKYDELKKYEHELADLCGVSRFSAHPSDQTVIKIQDLRDEPRCERSWKRDGTVKLRSNGSMLSERDAKVLGID